MDGSAAREPVAVTGIGCHFPGARGPERFWELLLAGGDAIVEVPPDRWETGAFYDPSPGVPGKTCSRWGGYLDGIDEFDAGFFQISPREAAKIDPQQRLLLEVAWEAVEDAGLPAEALAGARAGVFVGSHWNDFENLHVADPFHHDLHAIRGSTRSQLAGRVSYALGLRGPSLSVDAACASSLVSVHLACRSLWAEESDVALAAGVNVLLLPASHIGFSQGGMLATDGRCKAFDARADGFVRSEGVAVVVLKPLARARADGDRVYAVVRGGAVNNDGRQSGAGGTPARAGQEAVLRQAYADAGVAAHRVHYVEAHGTGTVAGDPVEVGALATVLGEGRPTERPCAIGSVKTNIGHTEGAAGIAGFIKTALALHHRTVPASLHCHTPNPAIPWEGIPVRVQRVAADWPADRPLLAGVSSFGISGTNAHLVLEAAEPAARDSRTPPGPGAPTRLLPVSGRSPEAVRAAARTLAEALPRLVGPDGFTVDEVCSSAALRRTHHEHRAAVAGGSVAELVEGLRSVADGRPTVGPVPAAVTGRIADTAPSVVFVFAGQGGQWHGMGAAHLTYPVFREAVERCDEAFRPWLDWSVSAALSGELGDLAAAGEEVVQPALFTVQVALAELWRSWGVQPAAVVGHSMGEVAAAYTAGRLSLADAARVISRRSQLLREIRGRGAMALLGLSLAGTRRRLAGYEGRLAVAACNGPATTVVSGDRDAIEAILTEAERQEVFARRVKTDVAAHSGQLDPARDALARELADLRPAAGGIPFYSTVSGELLADGVPLDGAYWARNLREPVLFWPALERLRRAGLRAFVEVSPHPTLLPAIRDGVGDDPEILLVPSMRRDEGETVTAASLGQLYTAGAQVAWERCLPRSGRHVPLPTYPWQRTRVPRRSGGEVMTGGAAGRTPARPGGHPLLGARVDTAVHTDAWFYETVLDPRALPYLLDHRVQGGPVFPATGYVELALAAAAEWYGGVGPADLVRLSLHRALAVPPDGSVPIQIVLTATGADLTFQCYADGRADRAAQPEWVLHAQGTLCPPGPPVAPDRHSSSCPPATATELPAAEHYRLAQARGLDYGARFQTLRRLWVAPGETWAELAVPDAEGGHPAHPAVLDGCLQAVLAALPDGTGGTDLYLPVELTDWRCRRPMTDGSVAHARLRAPGPGGPVPDGVADRPAEPSAADAREVEADLVVTDAAGEPVLAGGVRLRRVGPPAAATDAAPALRHRVVWRPAPPPTTPPPGRYQPGGTAPDSSPLDGATPGVPPAPQRYLLFDRPDGRLWPAVAERDEEWVLVSPGDRFRRAAPDRYEIDPASRADIARLLADLTGDGRPLAGVVHGWAAAPPAAGPGAPSAGGVDAGEWDPAAAFRQLAASGLHLVQELAGLAGDPPRLWLVTTGAVAVLDGDGGDPVAATLWGIGRTTANEHPSLRCTLVDLDPEGDPRGLLAELAAQDEDQVAWRGGLRYAARLVPVPDPPLSTPAASAGAQPHERSGFRLELAATGSFDQLRRRTRPRRSPAAGEVEIEVAVTALNFKDVMHAMGLLDPGRSGPTPLGIECAGRVTATGPGVTGFAAGDPVVAVTEARGGCLASHVVCDARTVAQVPDGVPLADAVTVPIAFLTAHYGLREAGRVRSGERVLVHAATGGVGLAAVQVARAHGATVLATAGTEQKRRYLRERLDIPDVMDSRSIGFGAQVRELTGGRGVDVVLNSLTGQAVAAGLAALAPHGRFVELGKRDMLENSHLSLLPFQRALSYSAVDVEAVLRDRPAELGGVLRELMAQLGRGELSPLPAVSFPVHRADQALRHLSQARHIGKVLVTMAGDGAPDSRTPIRSDGSYLVSGGLGALGLRTARLLVERGARHLVLLGRGAPTPATAEALGELGRRGATVVTAQVDVTDGAAVARLGARFGGDLPPLRGVVHAAGVLADRMLPDLTWEELTTAAAPKLVGGWHLHRLAAGHELDFFVLFSSVAALLGSPGQANYAAGNCALDALAYLRRRQGLPAQSINWGPWSEIGLAAAPERGDRLAERGLATLAPDEAAEALADALAEDRTQVVVGRIDARRWAAFAPPAERCSLLRDLTGPAGPREPVAGDRGLDRAALLRAGHAARRVMLLGYLSAQVARVVRADPASVRAEDRVTALGVDSLMAMELKHRLDADIGASMPTTRLLRGPTVGEVADYLLGQLPAADSDPDGPGREGSASPAAAVAPPRPVAATGTGGGLAEQLTEQVGADLDAVLRQLLDEEGAGP